MPKATNALSLARDAVHPFTIHLEHGKNCNLTRHDDGRIMLVVDDVPILYMRACEFLTLADTSSNQTVTF